MNHTVKNSKTSSSSKMDCAAKLASNTKSKNPRPPGAEVDDNRSGADSPIKEEVAVTVWAWACCEKNIVCEFYPFLPLRHKSPGLFFCASGAAM